MAGKRVARLNEQFRREITRVLRTQVRDPRVGTPTVTGVEVTPDLWMARVHVRPDPSIPGESAGEELMEGLEAAAAYVRRELSQTLSLRRVPELRFQIDRSVEHAARIHALLAEVLPPDGADGAEGSEGPERADVPDDDPDDTAEGDDDDDVDDANDLDDLDDPADDAEDRHR